MFTLFTHLFQWIRQPAPAQDDLAHALMEGAGDRRDPRQADELRAAASAYLRVVR